MLFFARDEFGREFPIKEVNDLSGEGALLLFMESTMIKQSDIDEMEKSISQKLGGRVVIILQRFEKACVLNSNG